MFDINLHPLLGTDEVSGGIMVNIIYIAVDFPWNMCVTVAVLQSTPKFCFMVLLSVFFRGHFFFFMPADWLLLCSQIWNTHYNRVISQTFQLDLKL
jgi:hypothetical protein